jgi:transcriptional regulator with XRE-family HTH domain
MQQRTNKRFFDTILAERGVSQRELARKLHMDSGAVSRTFAGKRAMKLHEAVNIANLLGVSLQDVLTNAGVRHSPAGERMVPIVGKMDGHGEVELNWRASKDHVTGPHDLPENSVAIIADTTRSPLELVDGWTFYLAQPRSDIGALVGKQVVAAIGGSKFVHMAWIKRSSKPARYNLVGDVLDGFKDVEIEWASPVLWIKPS